MINGVEAIRGMNYVKHGDFDLLDVFPAATVFPPELPVLGNNVHR